MTPANYWKQVREAYANFKAGKCTANDVVVIMAFCPLALARIEELEAALSGVYGVVKREMALGDVSPTSGAIVRRAPPRSSGAMVAFAG